MEDTIRKPDKYTLKPRPAQAQAMDVVLWRCRDLYNAGREARQTAWQRCGVTVDYYQQKAELPGSKAAMPEYGEVNAQVLQDVVQRLDRA